MLGPRKPWNESQGNGLKGELVMMGQNAGPKKGETAKQAAGEKGRFLLRILQGFTGGKSVYIGKVCKAFIYKGLLVLESHKMVTKRSQKKHDKHTTKARQKNVTNT